MNPPNKISGCVTGLQNKKNLLDAKENEITCTLCSDVFEILWKATRATRTKNANTCLPLRFQIQLISPQVVTSIHEETGPQASEANQVVRRQVV